MVVTCTSGGGRTKKGTKKRGGGYGAGSAITAGALEWKPDGATDAADPKTGAAIPDPALPKVGGRRRKSRKGRKATKRRRTTRRRTMRGGNALVYNAGSVGYGYVGRGAGGLADATAYAGRTGMGAPSNPDGVKSA